MDYGVLVVWACAATRQKSQANAEGVSSSDRVDVRIDSVSSLYSVDGLYKVAFS